MLTRYLLAPLAALLLAAPRLAQAQQGAVGIGTTTPNASAALDVSSTSKGLLPPRLTTAQRDAIAAPAAGLTIYNTTTNKLNTWNGTSWDAALSATEQPAVPPGASNVSFGYSGGAQTYTVPANVFSLRIDAAGAAGAGGSGASTDLGGKGARVQATLAVSPGQVLTINVGGAGDYNTSGNVLRGGGYNGGGTVYLGGGGGGATDIRLSGGQLADRLLVAGGGGGGGSSVTSDASSQGGAGGNPNGGSGRTWSSTGGGGGATQTAGGSTLGLGSTAGSLGAGGRGGNAGSGGGGGGGGYYGGGGGFFSGFGAGGNTANGGSGGGGSSWVGPSGSGVSMAAGYQSGNGSLTVTPSLVYAAPVLSGANISGTWSVAGDDVYRATGNVGIGTASPAQKLDVVGNVKISGAGNGLTFPDGSVQTSASALGNLTGDVTSTGTTTTYTNVVPAAKGGAGTVSGLLKANGSGLVSAATPGTDYLTPAGAATGFIQNQAATAQAGGFNVAGAGTVGGQLAAGSATVGGRVGIGTTSPTQALDVRGSVRLGDDGGNSAAGPGQAIEFVGPGFSTDPVGVYRVNPAADQSELRVVVGDVPDANDKFVVGRMAGTNAEGGLPAGSFTPTFAVSSTGQVQAPGLAGTGTRVVTADAGGTLATQALPTDAQQLSISGSTLTLTNGGSVVLPSGGTGGTATGDNLGNHTATQLLNLQGNALIGTGDDLGTLVGVGVRADGGLNLAQNTAGNNLLLGYQAGQSLVTTTTDGYNNQFTGYQSGYSTTLGQLNQFSGYQSGYSNTTGFLNHFSGYQSGYENTTGFYNLFSGYRSGARSTTGKYNTYTGIFSGSNANGNNNTFVGAFSGYFTPTGDNHTYVGYNSGVITDGVARYAAPGVGNTYIGSNTGPLFGVGPITNTIALGNMAKVTTSNTIQLGNDAITSLRCQVGLTVTSDARFKYDVRANVPGLAFIERLRPVTYRLDTAKLAAFQQRGTLRPGFAADPAAALHTGFLAQEVEQVAQGLGYVFDGVHAPANTRDYYGLSYAQFVVPLVRAVQELSAENAALKARLAALEAQAAADKAQTTATLDSLAERLRRLEAGDPAAQAHK